MLEQLGGTAHFSKQDVSGGGADQVNEQPTAVQQRPLDEEFYNLAEAVEPVNPEPPTDLSPQQAEVNAVSLECDWNFGESQT